MGVLGNKAKTGKTTPVLSKNEQNRSLFVSFLIVSFNIL